MNMKHLDTLKDMLCEELEEITRKGELSAGDLDAAHKLTDTIKNIDKIEMLEDGGYSRTGDWEAGMRGNYGRDGDYGRGNSYSNRGRHYVRGHYSRNDGRERMISDIEDMMRDASGEEREIYKRAADILRSV